MKRFSLKELFKNTFEDHRGRPGQIGGSLPRSGGGSAPVGQQKGISRTPGGSMGSMRGKLSSGLPTGDVNPALSDVDMVGGHLDFRQLGERGKFAVTKHGVEIYSDVDFYNKKGDKVYGKIRSTRGTMITIVEADPKTGKFTGEEHILEMVDWKTGKPVTIDQIPGR